MIKFCNLILDAYQRGTSDKGRFDNEEVLSSEEEYSSYLLGELDDELHKQVNGYDTLIEMLKRLNTLQFKKAEFEAIHANIARKLPEHMTAERALERHFDFSVIAPYQQGGGGGGSDYIWKYKDDRAQFRESADLYRVHPGFRHALSLKVHAGGR